MYDIIVIGAGPGGTAAATRAAQLGGKVLLVERADLGGSCVNRNCIPLTTMLGAVELYRRIQQAGALGIRVGEPTLDLPAMLARKDTVVQELREGLTALLPTFGMDVMQGQARLVDARTVEVDGQAFQAKCGIIIATGARAAPAPPGIQGIMSPQEAIAFDPLPGRVLIWGSSAADVEFATVYAGLGVQVTMAMETAYPLPDEDYETGQRLLGILQSHGIQALANVRVQSSVKTDEGLQIVLAGARGEREVVADCILWCGRVPNTDGLGLERAGVALKDGAIAVDDRQQTSVPGIYAVGDVIGQPYYSSLATAGGLVAAENAMGQERRLDLRFVPRYAFSIPEVAAVGLTEDEAGDRGYDVEVVNIALNSNSRALGLAELEGGIKLVADRKRGKVLGVHIVGHRATEMIAEATLGLQLEMLVEDLAWAVRIHPTLSESMVEAARAVTGQALYVPKF